MWSIRLKIHGIDCIDSMCALNITEHDITGIKMSD